VNAALAQHPLVKENVTVLRTDRSGEKHLVSYIVPASRPSTGAASDNAPPPTTHAHQLEKDCRDFLRSRLPQYMVPRRVVVLRALPLTPNGKINRQGLPDPFEESEAETTDKTGDADESDVVRVLSDTERGLLEIFAKLLGASPLKIQLDDDFFELGGHSLLATQAIFHISQKLHVHLPINLLFQSPTITALAKYDAHLHANVRDWHDVSPPNRSFRVAGMLTAFSSSAAAVWKPNPRRTSWPTRRPSTRASPL
jgi:L-aminoadipate-semialdehyde dehydrogenase